MRCCLIALLLLTSATSGAQEMTASEREFADALSHATLRGSFTLSDNPTATPKPERYDLGEVRKVGARLWSLPTRIRYGEHDATAPIVLPIDFAGDTAVIKVDALPIPGMGTFSARVLMHNGRYAGYWQGAEHGGHLFGVIEKKPATETPRADAPANAPAQP